MASNLSPLPREDQSDPESSRLNFRAIGQNFRLLSDTSGGTSAKTLAARQGVLQRFSISENLSIPAGWYMQVVAPIIETGVAVTIEAGGLWFVDA